MSLRCAVIVNPVSGRAKGPQRAEAVRQSLEQGGARCTVHPTQQAGDARRFAGELADQVDVLVSVGGDGTLNEILRGLLAVGRTTPVALVPMGTANVVSRELDLPRDPARIAELILAGHTRALDLGQMDDERIFFLCAGFGFDASIVEEVHRTRPASGITMAMYYWPAAKAIFGYDYPPFTVRVDGEVVSESATQVIVGNFANYAGPFKVFPRAVPDDGVIDVCCLEGRGPLRYLLYAWRMLTNRLPTDSTVRYAQGRRVEVSRGPGLTGQVDGDPAGLLPRTLWVLPQAVRICCADSRPKS